MQNLNKDSVPVLDLRMEFNFKNTIVETKQQVMHESGGALSIGGVELYAERKDGSVYHYTEKSHPTEAGKKFSFEIQKATINKKTKNLNFADLYVERWAGPGLFTADIIVDVSKQPPIRKKAAEVGSYNGIYFYEIKGRRFSEKLSGSIPDADNSPASKDATNS